MHTSKVLDMGAELCFEGREMVHQECGQETIFTEGEQILLMLGVNVALRILFGNRIETTLVSCTDAIKSGKQVTEPNKLSKAFDKWCEM